MNPSSVDWTSVLTVAKTLVEIAFYLVTGTVVVLGLKSWSRELKGRSKYEAAKNVVAGSYRMRDAINNVREFMVLPGEWVERKQKEDESENERIVRDNWFAYVNRFRGVRDAFSQWYPAIVEAEALFDPDARKRIQKLEHCARRLRGAIDIVHRAQLAPRYQPSPAHQQLENIIYGMHPGLAEQGDKSSFDDGGFQHDLDSAVDGIKEYFSRFIEQSPGGKSRAIKFMSRQWSRVTGWVAIKRHHASTGVEEK